MTPEFDKIGTPVRRKEDVRLLTGRGEFSDDFSLPNQSHAVMVRSPHAHARLLGIDSDTASTMPGVLGVFTGEDCLADGQHPIPHDPLPSTKHDLKLRAPDGKEFFMGPHFLLPDDKVRHAGEAVAIVVAETRAQAADAAECVDVEYEPLPVVTETAKAPGPEAATVWDEVPDNVCIDSTFGDVDGTDAAFARADHVLRMEFDVARVTGVPMEPRAALGVYDASSDQYTLYAGSGGAVRQKREISATLGIPEDSLRVVSKDVGGNFGTRNRVYVEFGLVASAAKKVGRPVKFNCERSESFTSDYQGRDLVSHVELALDKDGNFLAMRADNISNVGARCVSLSPLGKGSAIINGPYAIPVATIRSRAVFTNTAPTQAYRSSGRPEVIFAMERLVDTAAREFGFDPVDLRRRNLVPASNMPYTNPLGMVYDSGEYEVAMDSAMRLADWDGYAARASDSRARGLRRGLGIACYVESSIGSPNEQAEITVKPGGVIDLIIGTQPSGQGHETSFAQVAAEWLGVPVETVRIIVGDTEMVKVGGGSHSGRSMRMAGTVIVMAADDLIAKGRRLAAHVLEAAETDIEFDKGRFSIGGTDRSIGWFDLAAEAEKPNLHDEFGGRLAVVRDNVMQTPVFPNGCHVCEIEVDPETGALQIDRYTAVDDVGRAINPLIVDGQTHGGIVQGVGQALWEHAVVDPESGQPLAGSFMDYGMPRADAFPSFVTEIKQVLSPTNPLGIKAGGEGGTTPAPGVIVNAIVDALSEFGVKDVSMPATPLRVWQAIGAARSS